MPLSAEDRKNILINVKIEHQRMFTRLDSLYAKDPEKAEFLASIESALIDRYETFEETDPVEN